jgi:hypothetical protein
MKALYFIARHIKGQGYPKWKQAVFVDHMLAKAVVVGGARRSARMATKHWSDPDAFEFCTLKRDHPESLWTANYSLTVDEEFWNAVAEKDDGPWKLFLHATMSSYGDRTGEPGFINADKLEMNPEGLEQYKDGNWSNEGRYPLEEDTKKYHKAIYRLFQKAKVKHITNPCGEISLLTLMGYCVIADLVPYHLDSLEEFEQYIRVTTRALIRTNLMNSIYEKEVNRTNRIGVGFTGLHEFAWKFFKLGFQDLIDEEKSQEFWDFIKQCADVVDDEAEVYSKRLGVNVPHTTRTMKPAGTTSKLFHLTEGMHLPAMGEYMRWVQFKSSDPLVEKYKSMGYPYKDLNTYNDMTIIGFPHRPEICKLGMGKKMVLASQATMEEQFKWLELVEKYWLFGDKGNQASYTLK